MNSPSVNNDVEPMVIPAYPYGLWIQRARYMLIIGFILIGSLGCSDVAEVRVTCDNGAVSFGTANVCHASGDYDVLKSWEIDGNVYGECGSDSSCPLPPRFNCRYP